VFSNYLLRIIKMVKKLSAKQKILLGDLKHSKEVWSASMAHLYPPINSLNKENFD